ncbi:hypothetical protein DBR32_07160 [Taibaiella sp. KBW10]|uniref:T9SS type A sorting domain-containing protein n=1 Tax=Taibaiella sp. KBW10 TaxID=2153357 RepID=UPI000F59B8B7|nr:T9SS type A sorting domain-containing protein [Taibaiella sp. KBW10]RQO31717.1 hypothetical protein DBR32_07160 [Taibaiella sp. KBW10]
MKTKITRWLSEQWQRTAKVLLVSATTLLSVPAAQAQIAYNYGWEPTTSAWTNSGLFEFERTTTAPCVATASTRANLYLGFGATYTSPVLAGSNGGDITLSYSYKVTEYTPVTVGAPADFGVLTVQYAQSTSGPWTTVQTIDATNHVSSASCATKTVTFPTGFTGNMYVRFVSTCASSADYWLYLDEVVISQGAAPTCFPISGLTGIGTGSASASISWTAATPVPANGYEYYYSTSNTAPTSATTASGAVGAGITTANISSLAANTTYYVWVRSVCAAANKSSWNAGTISFTTHPVAQTPATLPWTEDFTAGGGNWSFVGGTQANKWFVGSATGNTGNGLYVSNNNGTANAYATGNPSVTFAYRDVVIPPGTNDINLSFDWKGQGEEDYDYMRAWVIGTSQYPVAGTAITPANTPGALQIGGVGAAGNYDEGRNAGSTTWQHENLVVNATALAGTTVRVVLEWTNDESYGIQPPAAVDNINVVALSCGVPTAVQANAITNNATTISWTAPTVAPAGGYEYYYSTTNTAPTAATPASGTTLAGITAVNITPLAANTTYYYWVRSVCAATNKSLWSVGGTFTTENLVPRPWTEPFGATGPAGWAATADWLIGSVRGVTGNPGNNVYINLYGTVPTGILLTTNVGPVIAADSFKVQYKASQYTAPYAAVAAGSGYFKVLLSTNFGQSYTQIDSLPMPATNAWQNLAYPLAAYAGANVKIRIEATRTAGDFDLAFDNFSIDAVTCVNPVVNLGPDATICPATTTTLNAGNAGAAFLWNTGATTQTIAATAAGTYWVKVTNAGGCFATDTIVLTAGIAPVVALGNDTSICTNATLTLNAGNAGASYLWSTGATAQTINVLAQGSYWVKVTNAAGCIKADTINVTLLPVPEVDLGADTAICSNATLILDAGNAGAGYLWSVGATAQTIDVTTAGTYWVTVTNAAGCKATDTIAVSITPLPSADAIVVTGSSPTFGFSVSNGQNITGYSWNFGDNSALATTANPTHTFNVTTNTTFTVEVTLTNACGSVTLNKLVTVQPNSIRDINLSATALKLYPNPTQHSLTLENESGLKMEAIKIYNLLGQEVYTQTVQNTNAKQMIDVRHLASGMYNIRIQFAEGTTSRKFEVVK